MDITVLEEPRGRTALTAEEWEKLARRKAGVFVLLQGDALVGRGTWRGVKAIFDDLVRAGYAARVLAESEYRVGAR